jgi:hypothetical protein
MGNNSSRYKKQYNQHLTSALDSTIENINTTITDLKSRINNQQVTIDSFEVKYNRLDRKINDLQTQLSEIQQQQLRLANISSANFESLESKINERISIITKDMDSLLNNDKLLLEKMIEKKMLSTINESTDESLENSLD